MAITFIYPIKSTPQSSIDYNTNNKESIMVNKKDDGLDSLNYVMRNKNGIINEVPKEYLEKMKPYINIEGNKVIFETIKSALNCSVKNANEQWNFVRNKYKVKINKNKKENLQYCIVQNFGIDLDPLIANEIGRKFAEKYLNKYQCIISTHINTGYVHNHIEFNATSFIDGKKFNDCLKSIREIRKISDELCEEYNLHVLDKTRNFDLIKYKSDEGKIKFYEPTDRKNKIEENEFANRNDYRNTEKYKKYEGSHSDILKSDINSIVDKVNTYDEFIEQMKSIGYQIKDKNKNGSWRKNISFKKDTWDSFKRDCKLGQEYTREAITERIGANKGNKIDNTKDVKYKTDNMNNDNPFNSIQRFYEYKERKSRKKKNEIEIYVIADTQRMCNKVNTLDVRTLSNNSDNSRQILYNSSKKNQYLLDRINGNLKTLNFIEENKIENFDQIEQAISSLCSRRDLAKNELKKVNIALKKANEKIEMVKKYNILKDNINLNKDNKEYNDYEKGNDLELLKNYELILENNKLLSKDDVDMYIDKYNKFLNTYKDLSKQLENINSKIKEFDNCIFNIGYVDKENENKYKNQIERYYTIKNNDGKENSRQDDNEERE